MSLAWETLGDPQRRQQYHRQLGLSDPPKSETDHEGQTTDADRTQSDDETILDPDLDAGTQSEKATSTNGSRVVQDPNFLLDDPFTVKGPSNSEHSIRSSRPDTSVKSRRTSGLPPMRTFHNPAYKKSAATPPISNGSTDNTSQRHLSHPATGQPDNDDLTRNLPQIQNTAHYSERDYSTIVQYPTSAVREEVDTPNRVRSYMAKRIREDGIDSESEWHAIEDSGRIEPVKRRRRQTDSPGKEGGE